MINRVRTMRKSNFIGEMRDLLELGDVELSEGTVLAELEGYDSVSVMSIIALADESFGKKLTSQQLASITTLGSLMELIGSENIHD